VHTCAVRATPPLPLLTALAPSFLLHVVHLRHRATTHMAGCRHAPAAADAAGSSRRRRCGRPDRH
jgi:hypothetical protein